MNIWIAEILNTYFRLNISVYVVVTTDSRTILSPVQRFAFHSLIAPTFLRRIRISCVSPTNHRSRFVNADFTVSMEARY